MSDVTITVERPGEWIVTMTMSRAVHGSPARVAARLRRAGLTAVLDGDVVRVITPEKEQT